MNIFEIFGSGNGRLNEENMSSVLKFMLDPAASHGFGISSITEFLDPISDNIIVAYTSGRGTASRLSLRAVIASFKYCTLSLEETVFGASENNRKKSREIDLIIKLQDENRIPRLVIAIENKIVANSASDASQLQEEYAFLRAELDKDFPGDKNSPSGRIPIVFIYLTPEELTPGNTQKQWDNLNLPVVFETDSSNFDFKAHYTWKPRMNRLPSVTFVAQSLLHKEQDGSISPASSHASLFLRSMVKFIGNDFMPERLGEPVQESLNNKKEILTETDFWGLWNSGYTRASIELAKNLHKLVKDALLSERSVESKDIDFSKTRVAYHDPDRKLRPVALMLQDSNAGRVALQVKLGMDEDKLQSFTEAMRHKGISVARNRVNLELQIPIDIDMESLSNLIGELVAQLPRGGEQI